MRYAAVVASPEGVTTSTVYMSETEMPSEPFSPARSSTMPRTIEEPAETTVANARGAMTLPLEVTDMMTSWPQGVSAPWPPGMVEMRQVGTTRGPRMATSISIGTRASGVSMWVMPAYCAALRKSGWNRSVSMTSGGISVMSGNVPLERQMATRAPWTSWIGVESGLDHWRVPVLRLTWFPAA